MPPPLHTSFPIAWVTTGKTLLLVGGCSGHFCRLKQALAFDWKSIAVSVPEGFDPPCADCAADARVQMLDQPVCEDDIAAADLVIESTADPVLARKLDGWCARHNVPLNAMDQEAYCDFNYMSLLMRGPLILSIASGGRAPALCSKLRQDLDRTLGPGWAEAASQLAALRERLPAGHSRRELLKKLAYSAEMDRFIHQPNAEGMRQWIQDAVDRMSD